MKKIVSMLLVAAMCCGLLMGCGGNGNSEEVERLKKENAELKLEIEQLKGEDGETGDDTSEKSQLDKMVLNEPYEVKTEKGTYKITMQGAYLTDWYREGDGRQVIALQLEVENIDFKRGELTYGMDGCLINWNVFKVSDENGYMLRPWDATMSVYGFPDMIEPGYKAKQELPYVVDRVPAEIKVIFYRDSGDIAEITIPVAQ